MMSFNENENSIFSKILKTFLFSSVFQKKYKKFPTSNWYQEFLLQSKHMPVFPVKIKNIKNPIFFNIKTIHVMYSSCGKFGSNRNVKSLKIEIAFNIYFFLIIFYNWKVLLYCASLIYSVETDVRVGWLWLSAALWCSFCILLGFCESLCGFQGIFCVKGAPFSHF